MTDLENLLLGLFFLQEHFICTSTWMLLKKWKVKKEKNITHIMTIMRKPGLTFIFFKNFTYMYIIIITY